MDGQLQLFGGGWTEIKLGMLKAYLDAYMLVMKNQPFKTVYIDAFAGTGYREQRESEYNDYSLFEDYNEADSKKFLDGSAKIGLQIQRPFDEYIFIEKHTKKVAELEKLKKEFSSKTILIENSDANDFLMDFCKTTNWRNTRAVLFLDPFATEVKWKTFEEIARTGAIDTWILFPLMAVNRLLSHDHKKAITHKLDEIFGTHEWFEKFYKVDDTFFGETSDIALITRNCDIHKISAYFTERLKTIFRGVAENPRVLRTEKNIPLFLFHFATAAFSEKGVKHALDISQHILGHL